VRAAAKRKTINRGTKRRLRILALRFQNPAFHTKTRDNLHQSSSATAALSAKWPRTNRHLSECKSGRLAKKAKTPLFGMNNLWGELHAHPLGFALHQDCHHFSLSRQFLVIALSETDIKNLPQIVYFSFNQNSVYLFIQGIVIYYYCHIALITNKINFLKWKKMGNRMVL
jgi:hypothetical protein